MSSEQTPKYFHELDEGEQRRILEQHRKRLPELDRQFAEGMRDMGAELPPRLQRALRERAG